MLGGGCASGDSDDGIVTRSVMYLYNCVQKSGRACTLRCAAQGRPAQRRHAGPAMVLHAQVVLVLLHSGAPYQAMKG